MKTFKNFINRKEFINEFGEKMILVMSEDLSIWVHHNDCNKDFETLDYFSSNYIINREETLVIINFIQECTNIVVMRSENNFA